MPDALLVGGTGPSGPSIVHGLLERDFAVAVLHTGQHEADLPAEVEHIHTDPHFPELVREALGDRQFDVAVATYGRVRYLVDVLIANTGRVVTVGGNAYGLDDDPGWGPLGVPLLVNEHEPAPAREDGYKLHHKVWVTEQHLLAVHEEAGVAITILRYPLVYGPNSPANPDWSVVRRILDNRPVLLLEGGGNGATNRGFGPNLALAVLLAVDRPDVASGKIYNVADVAQYSERALAAAAAEYCGHEFEFVDIPRPIASRVYRDPVKRRLGFQAFDTTRIQTELGYRDSICIPDAVERSVRWLWDQSRRSDGDLGGQLGDPFDYAYEDKVAEIYRRADAAAFELDWVGGERSHMYRHPRTPGERWRESSAWNLASDET